MSKRTDALWRVWALIWQTLMGYIVSIVIGIVAIVWMLIDIIWQLIAGSDGLDSNSTIATHVGDAVRWSAGQTIYAVTGGGDGEFRWFWTM